MHDPESDLRVLRLESPAVSVYHADSEQNHVQTIKTHGAQLKML